jgi:hypothetical protein
MVEFLQHNVLLFMTARKYKHDQPGQTAKKQGGFGLIDMDNFFKHHPKQGQHGKNYQYDFDGHRHKVTLKKNQKLAKGSDLSPKNQARNSGGN